jgi:hypothetical protein
MSNTGTVTPNLDTEMDALRDDELDVASGSRKTATAKTKVKEFDNYTQDHVVTAAEFQSLS